MQHDPRDVPVEAACRSRRDLPILLDTYAKDPDSMKSANAVATKKVGSKALAKRLNLGKKLLQKWLTKLLVREDPLDLRKRTYQGFKSFSYAGYAGMIFLINDVLREELILGSEGKVVQYSDVENCKFGTLAAVIRSAVQEAEWNEFRDLICKIWVGQAPLKALYEWCGVPFKTPGPGVATAIWSWIREIAERHLAGFKD